MLAASPVWSQGISVEGLHVATIKAPCTLAWASWLIRVPTGHHPRPLYSYFKHDSNRVAVRLSSSCQDAGMVITHIYWDQLTFANGRHCLKRLQVLTRVAFKPPYLSPFHRGGQSLERGSETGFHGPELVLASMIWYRGHALDRDTVLPLKKRLLREAVKLRRRGENLHSPADGVYVQQTGRLPSSSGSGW